MFFRDSVILLLKLPQGLAMLQLINKTLRHIFTAVQVQAYDCAGQMFSDTQNKVAVFINALCPFLRLHLAWCFSGSV